MWPANNRFQLIIIIIRKSKKMTKTIMKNSVQKILLNYKVISLIPVLLFFSCMRPYVHNNIETINIGPDKILLHNNAALGDYAIYSVDYKDGKNYKVTTEIISVKNGLYTMRSSDEHNRTLYATTDKDGNVKKYGDINGGYLIPDEPVSQFLEETVLYTYDSKQYKTKPFLYSWEISAKVDSMMVNSSTKAGQYYVAYTAPGIHFQSIYTKCEIILITGANQTNTSKLMMLAIQIPQYILTPQTSLDLIVGPDGLASYLLNTMIESNNEKMISNNMGKSNIDYEMRGNLLSGNWEMKLSGSFTMTLIKQGNRFKENRNFKYN